MKQYNDTHWQEQMKISIDYNNIMSDTIGSEHGITKTELQLLVEPVKEIMNNINDRKVVGKDFLGFLNLPYKSKEEIQPIISTADRLASISDIHIVLGIGGSYLGANALIKALLSPYYNELPREKRNNRPRIYFEGNNIDSDSIYSLMELLPKDKPKDISEHYSINVISKSGGTLETAVAFRIFQHKIKQTYGNEHNKYIVATTDIKKGNLREIVNHEGYESFVIPDDVGGRYSVLTPVGLLPASITGIDIYELLEGARFMAERCKTDNVYKNPALSLASFYYLLYKKGKNISLLSIWNKSLEYIGYWYDQLVSESLGKGGVGRVPITGVNTRDLHSRGQQIQDGARNTVITNLITKKFNTNIQIKHDDKNLDGLNYLTGKTLPQMIEGAYLGTNYAYTKDKRPNMNIIIPEVNAFTIGQLFYMFELATIVEGYLLGINPMDQPGVESYKKFMFGILGRPDMKKYKEEFEKFPSGSKDYII